jgi:tetratricopeptide (TPR) repeat protein
MDKVAELLALALAEANKGELIEARALLSRALEFAPDNPTALHLSAAIDYQLGELPHAALARIDRAILLDPTIGQFHNSRGAILYALGDDERAAQSFLKATEIEPSDGVAWNNLGNALIRMDRLDDAESCYRQALAVAPGSIAAINNLGTVLKKRGELEKALICFREAERLDPDYLDAVYNLGELLYHLDLIGEAELQFRRAIELAPDFKPAHASLGQALHDLGKAEEALEVLRAALVRFPGDPDLEFAVRLQMSSMAPAWHVPMINDTARNQAYDTALRRAVRPGDLVFEIGSGSGLVAMMAARSGAGRVVSCEVHPLMAELAREIVAINGYADRVSIINRKSTRIRLGEDLPDRADVFVCELINVGMLAPNMLPVLQHARENLLKPTARIIPAGAIVHARLLECPHLHRVNPVGEIEGFNLGPLDRLRSPGYASIDLACDPHRKLSAATPALEFDFKTRMPERDARVLEFTATAEGIVHGIAFWFDLILDDETVYSSLDPARTNHWKQAIEFLPRPIPVGTGEKLSVIAGYDNTRISFKPM